MNNDRFKFRIYSKVLKRYYEDNDRILYINRSISYQEALRMCIDDCGVIIEQCTGLKDKNGKLIYEGDLIEDEDKITYEIFWNNEASRFVAGRNGDDNRYNKGVLLWGDCEIISNIHENKE